MLLWHLALTVLESSLSLHLSVADLLGLGWSRQPGGLQETLAGGRSLQKALAGGRGLQEMLAGGRGLQEMLAGGQGLQETFFRAKIFGRRWLVSEVFRRC